MNDNIKRTQSHSVSQLTQLDNWLTEYITVNRDLFIQTGIACSKVYSDYTLSTNFPVGRKTFGPHIREHGVDLIRKASNTYYVLFI